MRIGETANIRAGLAFISTVDLYTRPSEPLSILHEDITAPHIGRYMEVAADIAPASRLVLPIHSAHAGVRKERKAAKSGEFDDTVAAGLKGLGLECHDRCEGDCPRCGGSAAGPYGPAAANPDPEVCGGVPLRGEAAWRGGGRPRRRCVRARNAPRCSLARRQRW